MLPSDHEKFVFSVIFNFPSGNELIPQRICAELDPDKFETTEHKKTYNAIQALTLRNDVPTIVNVATELGEDLEKCGGLSYLEGLKRFLPDMGVHDYKGFEKSAKVVDNAGRLRHLGLVVDKYHGMYKDFPRLVRETKDVNEFLENFLTELQEGIGGVKTFYKPIGIAVDEALRYLDQSEKGLVTSLVAMGWPNLEKYLIPRIQTFGVIIGLPSMGKTQLALQIALGAAKNIKETGQEGVVTINSLETSGLLLASRMACCLAGIDSNSIDKGTISKEEGDKYREKLLYVKSLPIEYDDNPGITTSELTWQAIAQNLKTPRILAVSDYLELFNDTGASEELRVSNIVKNVKKICWHTASCEILLSQLNNSVLMTKSKIAGLQRARYSGAVSHAADWGMEIWNPPEMRRKQIDHIIPDGKSKNMAYVLIEKNKNGPTGEEPFKWTPEYTRFTDTSLPIGDIYREYTQADF